MPTIDLDNTKQLARLGELLSAAATDLSFYPLLADHSFQFETTAHDLRLPPLVVVMGTFKSGKSTLLNAILGETLLSTNVLPETATVTMLRKGRKGKIFGHFEGHPVRKWPISKLAALSSETTPATAAIRESISFIEVPIDLPLLDRVTLVDTPGVNSQYEKHTQATKSFCHRSEAVLWIVSSLQPLNSVEEAWIKALREDIKVLVVVNQIDLLDPDETPVSRIVERVRNSVERQNVSVTAVSGKLALEGILNSNKGALNASLWSSFLEDCDREVFHFDTSRRLQRASRDVHRLVDLLFADISEYLREADRYRLKARGGKEYYDSLETKLRMLAEAEREMLKSEDVREAMQSLSIEEYWESSKELELKRQALTGALLAIDEKQSAINREVSALTTRRERFQPEVDKFNQDWTAYMTSGLFGGEPKMFTGGKDKLLRRRQILEQQQSFFGTEQKEIRSRERELDSVRERTKGDCAKFLEIAGDSIRNTIASVVRESEHAVQDQGNAAAELAGLKWLAEYANRSCKKNLWTEISQLTVSSLSDVPVSEADRRIEQLIRTIESIPGQEWNVVVQNPLPLPKEVKRTASAKGARIESWRLVRDALILVPLLPIRILTTSFGFARRHPVFAISLGVILYFVTIKSGLLQRSSATAEVASQPSSQAAQSSTDSDSSAAKTDTATTEQTATGPAADPEAQSTESTEQEAKALYDQGRYSDAIPLFDQACNVDGGKEACVELGNLYRNGVGVAIDKSRATNLFQKACTMGDQDGCHQLKELQALDALDAPDTRSDAARKQREKAALKALEQ
jgi:small GTP-binding protein